MMTAEEFAKAIDVPYPTVALWLREGRVKGAEQLELGRLKVWQIPASAVNLYQGDQKRPKRGRPLKPASKRSKVHKAKGNIVDNG